MNAGGSGSRQRLTPRMSTTMRKESRSFGTTKSADVARVGAATSAPTSLRREISASIHTLACCERTYASCRGTGGVRLTCHGRPLRRTAQICAGAPAACHRGQAADIEPTTLGLESVAQTGCADEPPPAVAAIGGPSWPADGSPASGGEDDVVLKDGATPQCCPDAGGGSPAAGTEVASHPGEWPAREE